MRAVIAENLVLLRDGVARALRADGIDVVDEVDDAGEMIHAVAEQRPDLAIVDVRMPPGFSDEGGRATLLLRERFPDLAVLVLSHTVDPQLALLLAAQRPAGFGYLLKDRVMDMADFVVSVRVVAAGGTVIDPIVVDRGLSRRSGTLAGLTEREHDVLAELARGRSNAAIAAALDLSERTVEAHVRSVFLQLGLTPSDDANRRVQAALAWLGAES